MKDGKSRSAAPKATKSAKIQRTLFDMFPKQLSSTLIETTITPPSPDMSNREAEGTRSAVREARPVTPTSEGSADQSNSLLSTPKQKSMNIPMFQGRGSIERTLIDPPCLDIEFDILPVAVPNSLSSEGTTRDTPIVIDSSPTKPVLGSMDEDLVPKARRPVHPFFAPRTKTQASNSTTTPRHRAKALDAPYPKRGSQHVRGFQTVHPFIPCPFACRAGTPSTGTLQQRLEDDTSHLTFLLSPHEQIEDPCDHLLPLPDPKIHVSSINQTHIRDHPAIARAVDATGGDPPSRSLMQLWTETWRPRCAKEVLGNEQSAIYLRNWLHTLALQLDPTPKEGEGNIKRKKKSRKKRPRVVRAVARKKPRKDGLDDFVVDDEEEEEYDETPDYGLDDLVLESQGSGLGDEMMPTSLLSDVPETINARLRNTILLTGPPGSGKTAAVFACAEELGWEVFEVYPGIGRRNGANVDSLVGEVGKNHLVRTKQNTPKHQPLADLLANGAGAPESNTDVGLGTGLLDEEHDGEPSFCQSLILLEEVDVLFRDDVNFWPAVTNFIKDCRRPVICTCNDVSLVPTDSLPLQSILYFKPCTPPVATSYLQGLTCAEGYGVSPEFILEVYRDTYRLSGADVPGDSDPTTAHLELPEFDLRKTIHSLQLWCTTGGRWESKNRRDWESNQDILDDSMEVTWSFPHDEQTGLPTEREVESAGAGTRAERERSIWALDAINQQADLASYLDSSVLLPMCWRRERVAAGELQASSDDENGYAILYGSSANYEIAMHGFHDRDSEMASAAIRLARGSVAPGLARGRTSIDGDGVHLRWGLFRARVDYQRLIGEGLCGTGVVDGVEGVRSGGGKYTEYGPYVRAMAREGEETSPRGRVTRNSQRRKRTWVLGREGRTAMAATGFGMTWTD